MKKTVVDYIIDVGVAISIGLLGLAALHSFVL
jgi:hypothetical protein